VAALKEAAHTHRDRPEQLLLPAVREAILLLQAAARAVIPLLQAAARTVQAIQRPGRTAPHHQADHTTQAPAAIRPVREAIHQVQVREAEALHRVHPPDLTVEAVHRAGEDKGRQFLISVFVHSGYRVVGWFY
jgi:hypothetical protein